MSLLGVRLEEHGGISLEVSCPLCHEVLNVPPVHFATCFHADMGSSWVTLELADVVSIAHMCPEVFSQPVQGPR